MTRAVRERGLARIIKFNKDPKKGTRAIKITYKKANGRTVKRKIDPLKLDNGLLGAYDHKRKAWRSFRMDRMKHMEKAANSGLPSSKALLIGSALFSTGVIAGSKGTQRWMNKNKTDVWNPKHPDHQAYLKTVRQTGTQMEKAATLRLIKASRLGLASVPETQALKRALQKWDIEDLENLVDSLGVVVEKPTNFTRKLLSMTGMPKVAFLEGFHNTAGISATDEKLRLRRLHMLGYNSPDKGIKSEREDLSADQVNPEAFG